MSKVTKVSTGRQYGKTTVIVTDTVPNPHFTAAPFPLDRLILNNNGFWGPVVPKPPPETATAWCDHKWVDVGFTHSKIVCAKCNIEKPFQGE